MKSSLLLGLFVCFSWCATAQYDDPAVPAAALTAELTERYRLSEAQQTQMQTIQERYFTHLTKLEKLESADLAYYVKKRRALHLGTEHSIEMLLDKTQRKTFDQARRARRRQQAELVQALAGAGKSELEIQRALLDVK